RTAKSPSAAPGPRTTSSPGSCGRWQATVSFTTILEDAPSKLSLGGAFQLAKYFFPDAEVVARWVVFAVRITLYLEILLCDVARLESPFSWASPFGPAPK